MGASDAERLVGPLWEEWVEEHDVEPERLGPERRRRADPATADDPERLTAEPGGADGRFVVPRPRADRVVARNEPSGDGQQEHDRVIGDLLGAVVGDVTDDHPMTVRRFEVHVVVAHTGPDDALATRGEGQGRFAESRDVVEKEEGV